MLAKIQKWGNSQGLRLNKGVLEDAQIEVGTVVDVMVKDGTIVITPARRIRGKHCLHQLVERIPDSYQVEETDWDEPVGKEEW